MEWIACKDSLPDKQGIYLVYLMGSDNPEEYLIDIAYWDLRTELYGWTMNGITHWMPLPEPPKVTE